MTTYIYHITHINNLVSILAQGGLCCDNLMAKQNLAPLNIAHKHIKEQGRKGMIELISGNLLQADVEALVNTVNTVGVMGKGIALQFRQAYPENYKLYRAACKKGEVQIGKMLVVPVNSQVNPRYIINFPTKQHWKNKSRLEDIEAGLLALVAVVREKQIRSLAIPALGCKNGGLAWADVRPRIEAALNELSDVHVLLYPPNGAPDAEQMQITTARPALTPGRAAIIGLMEQYALPGYKLSMLEIQKLAYFLQEAGEPLQLNFVRYHYGPYAENLQHVLQRLEGHYIRGYGDRSRSPAIHLVDGAKEAAETFLSNHQETGHRIEQVSRLIEGFESPYGLELLATVHWLAQYEDPAIQMDVDSAVRGVQAWSERKRNIFVPEHIEVAWKRLHQEGWIGATREHS